MPRADCGSPAPRGECHVRADSSGLRWFRPRERQRHHRDAGDCERDPDEQQLAHRRSVEAGSSGGERRCNNRGCSASKPATLAWLEALAVGDDDFTRKFGLRVAPGWLVFPEVLAITIEVLRAGDSGEWGMQLFFDDDVLVGNGGWKGAPVNGAAELGYAVAPEYRNRGIATAVVRTLVERADAAGVRLVVAHTLAEKSASTSVLAACGFTKVGDLVDPDDGELWRWELPRPPRSDD